MTAIFRQIGHNAIGGRMQKGAVRKGRAFCFMCAGHNTRSGVKLSNGPVRRTQIAELTLSPPLLRPRTDARLSNNSNITQPFPQPLHNRFPTPHQPSGTSTHSQPPEAARRTIPRLANTHDSTILRVESKNDFDTTILYHALKPSSSFLLASSAPTLPAQFRCAIPTIEDPVEFNTSFSRR